MNYEVDWPNDVLATLAAVWVRTRDRKGVTVAQAAIDQALLSDPRGSGTPVSEGLYRIEVLPLRVQFEISEDDHVVTVVSVRELP
ncbi:MAG TPA: type II toxin-antitoxin system RelE/ParE family toxin [Gemmataceae bacterium]|nr:type II toxin-antitoxin system RelE/ParE family toxin [Gemmataceae bacterium]